MNEILINFAFQKNNQPLADLEKLIETFYSVLKFEEIKNQKHYIKSTIKHENNNISNS